MNLQFKPIEASDVEKITPFYALRPNKTCDSVYLDCFIWREYYHVKYAISDNKALQFFDGKGWPAFYSDAYVQGRRSFLLF